MSCTDGVYNLEAKKKNFSYSHFIGNTWCVLTRHAFYRSDQGVCLDMKRLGKIL